MATSAKSLGLKLNSDTLEGNLIMAQTTSWLPPPAELGTRPSIRVTPTFRNCSANQRRRIMPLFSLVGLMMAILLGCFTQLAVAQEPTQTPQQLEFFESKIRPVLVLHCYECHSADSKNVKGGLLLDTRAAILKGGDSGPAVVEKTLGRVC